MSTPRVGDICWAVYVGAASRAPKLGRQRLESFSPTGKMARWMWFDDAGRPLGRPISRGASWEPAVTPDDAISRFQRYMVQSSVFDCLDDGSPTSESG